MDRYVLVVSFNEEGGTCPGGFKPVDAAKQIYEKLGNISSRHLTRRRSLFPACSLSGVPSAQRWYFALQVCQGTSQYCSAEWEELGAGSQKSDSEDESPSLLEECLCALRDDQEGQNDQTHTPPLTELYEEAADGLHLLSDKLPPPGKALLDVMVLGIDREAPNLRDFLPVMGSLKHMQAWHSAKTTVLTQHTAGWQKAASYLSASMVDPADLETCIDATELWRGGLLIREKKCASELRFEGFSLRSRDRQTWSSLVEPVEHPGTQDHKLHPEAYHFYQPVLDLVQLVTVSDLPSFLRSSTEFDLGLSGRSVKAKLLLDQLRPLCGKVGALFSLSCVVSTMVQPPASQLSSQKWKEFVARRPKTLPVPDVEVKGESARYFLLVQGSEGGGCKARMMHSANQINGAAAMATVYGLLKENSLSSSGSQAGGLLRTLPRLQPDQLQQRERRVMRMQTLVLKECLRRRVDAETPAVPVNNLKALLNLAREQYLQIHQPTAAPCLPEDQENTVTKTTTATKTSEAGQPPKTADWPERSVLQNVENVQRGRQKRRFGLLSGPGSSDSLLGPKDCPRVAFAQLDAKELLRHFTADGLPSAELQPLLIHRGGNAFQLSPDLTPRKVTQLPFSKAASSHYHGIEFCLDDQRGLERDRGFVKLQSRLIRYETQTTCSREPCPLPFALSPAPSPAVLSEPGSVPDGEALQNADVTRLKRRSWETDAAGHPRKRLAKSESCESLGSQGSGSSGTYPAIRALRQQPTRSQSASTSSSTSSTLRRSAGQEPPVGPPVPRGGQSAPKGGAEDKAGKESRSQKHIRMLRDVVERTLKHHGISADHEHFHACSQRLFEISKFYLKDLKTSRGLHEEMKKAASSNAKQVIDWVLEKASKK